MKKKVTAYAHPKMINKSFSQGMFSPPTSDWMSVVPDEQSIAHMSIPGTHDSCATVNIPVYGPNQMWDIKTQLEKGIRFLDIRCRVYGDILAIHHGIVYEKINFGGVLNICTDFLSEHPTETILMRIKQEYSTASDAEFISVYETYIPGREGCLYQDGAIPNIGSVRGKIVIISNVSGLPGIPFDNLGLEDNYKANYFDKLGYVKKNLAKSVKEHFSRSNVLFLTFFTTDSYGDVNFDILDTVLTLGIPDYMPVNTNVYPYYGIIATDIKNDEMNYSRENFITNIIKFNNNKYLNECPVVSLRNIEYNDYVYTYSWHEESDMNRRPVLGWMPGDKVMQAYWIFIPIDQSQSHYALYNTYSKEYMYATGSVTDNRRLVRTWTPGWLDYDATWEVSGGWDAGTVMFKNTYHNNWLYSSSIEFSGDRRNVCCWASGEYVQQSQYEIVYV